MQMTQKDNVVLYLDKKLVEKSKEIGFNLSKTFENHLKQVFNENSPISTQINGDFQVKNDKWWAEPDLNRRPLARKANVLTRLDDRPPQFACVQPNLSCLD
jgi:Post-segregation antitoxin CcdA